MNVADAREHCYARVDSGRRVESEMNLAALSRSLASSIILSLMQKIPESEEPE